MGLRAYLGDGRGGWTPVTTQLATTGGYGDVCMGDFDGDGNSDVFASSPGDANGNPRGLHVFKGDGSGGFTEVTGGSGLPTTGRWRGVDVGDVNNDGKLDVAGCSGYGDRQGTHVYLGDGNGKFTDASDGLPGNQDRDSNVVLADLNGDGDLDVAVGGAAGVDVYLGNGGSGGSMSWSQSSSGLPDERFSGITAADVDGDGQPDLVISSYAAGSGVGIYAYRNDNRASSWTSTSSGLPSSGDFLENAVADVTGDGNADIVATGGYSKTYGVHIFEGDGEGSWTECSPGLPTDYHYVGVCLGDLDSDGDDDILTGRRTGGGGIKVWRNPRVGTPPPWPEVSVIAPSETNALTGGTDHQIEWAVASGTPPYSISLHYSEDGGTTYPHVITEDLTQSDEGTGEFLWTLPEEDSTTVRVLVEVVDACDMVGEAMSEDQLAVDSTPPEVSSTFPVDEATGVSISTPIIITFTEGMDPDASDAVTVSGPGDPSVGAATWSGTQLTLEPTGLRSDSAYEVTVTTSARDSSVPGNEMATAYTFAFVTGSSSTPAPARVMSTSPEHGAVAVSVETGISVTFSEAMERTSVTSVLSSSPSIEWAIGWSGGDTKLSLTPRVWLMELTQYTISIGIDAMSATGSTLATTYEFSFTTGRNPDVVPPRVSGTAPMDLSTGVCATAPVVISFNEPMDRSATVAAVSIDRGRIDDTTWNADSTELTLALYLSEGEKYVLTVSTAARDAAGNHLASKYSLTFVTDAAEVVDEGPDDSLAWSGLGPVTLLLLVLSGVASARVRRWDMA
jgi:hypothetical protein